MSISDREKSFTVLTVVWGAVALIGGVGWYLATNGGEGARAWRAILSNFLFFSSLSAGLVVWPAVVRGCNGTWHTGLERVAAAAAGFSLPSIIAVMVLWQASHAWSPWYHAEHHQGLWLENGFVFGRNIAALVFFWALALFYLAKRRHGPAPVAGGWLILVYALVFSLIGMDFVMALDPHWFSTLAGGYFFISGIYIGITGWAFLAVWQPQARQEQLKDLGRLIVAFSLMTTYLMYAHLLPIWYENLPHEVRFMVPRMNFRNGTVISYILLAVVYFGPLVLLLTERSKGNRWSLGAISLLVLVGAWLERWWLVALTFNPAARPGLEEIAAAALFLGVFGLCVQLVSARMPGSYPSGDR